MTTQECRSLAETAMRFGNTTGHVLHGNPDIALPALQVAALWEIAAQLAALNRKVDNGIVGQVRER